MWLCERRLVCVCVCVRVCGACVLCVYVHLRGTLRQEERTDELTTCGAYPLEDLLETDCERTADEPSQI